MIVIIDNYDSFTYNLVQYLKELGAIVEVIRNDCPLAVLDELRPDRIVISPGPGHPAAAGITLEVVRCYGPNTPILGVCLGHQAIGFSYGWEVQRAAQPMHGKASTIRHDGNPLFAGIPRTFQAGCYHSLVVKPTGNGPLRCLARADDGEVMALRHIGQPTFGVQFHPESILTDKVHGLRLLQNFLAIS